MTSPTTRPATTTTGPSTEELAAVFDLMIVTEAYSLRPGAARTIARDVCQRLDRQESMVQILLDYKDQADNARDPMQAEYDYGLAIGGGVEAFCPHHAHQLP